MLSYIYNLVSGTPAADDTLNQPDNVRMNSSDSEFVLVETHDKIQKQLVKDQEESKSQDIVKSRTSSPVIKPLATPFSTLSLPVTQSPSLSSSSSTAVCSPPLSPLSLANTVAADPETEASDCDSDDCSEEEYDSSDDVYDHDDFSLDASDPEMRRRKQIMKKKQPEKKHKTRKLYNKVFTKQISKDRQKRTC